MKRLVYLLLMGALCTPSLFAQKTETHPSRQKGKRIHKHLQTFDQSPPATRVTEEETDPVPGFRTCGTQRVIEEMIANDPGFAERYARFIEERNNLDPGEKATPPPLVTIPVVVHVIYRVSSDNISDAQVQSQIDVLNQDYRRMNSDTNLTPVDFKPFADDVNIEFCLATRDPDGNPTNGITRTSTSIFNIGAGSEYYQTSAGGHDAWDTRRYLNFWICDIGGGTLGFATPPGTSSNRDGVVIDARYFGNTGIATFPFNKGRTATHEVGHWLGLSHTWGDGPCGVDDGVADTPESDNANYNCPTSHTSCGSRDMVQNYMDYTDDACMNLFTQGQAFVIQNTITTSRNQLLTSPGCDAVTGECAGPDTLNFPLPGTAVIYTSDNPGYMAGHNGYGDLAKANFFNDYAPSIRLDGIRFDFGVATSSGPTAKVIAKVWDGSSGTPTTELASKDLLINDIIASGGEISVMFDDKVDISGNFFAGIELIYGTGDTVALISTTDGDIATNMAWEKFDDGTWHEFDEASSWGASLSLAIFPIVTDEPNLQVSPPMASISSGSSVTFNASGATSYTWTPATGLSTTTGSTVTASPTSTTAYQLTGTSSTGCETQIWVIVEVDGIAAVEDGFKEGDLTVYPNPSEGMFMMKFGFEGRKDLELQVTDLMGRTILKRDLNSVGMNDLTSFDLRSQADGIYLVNVREGSNIWTNRVIKR